MSNEKFAKPVQITVIKALSRTYGYNLWHNQPIGWNGTISKHFGWYKLKSDAIKRANELMASFQKTNP